MRKLFFAMLTSLFVSVMPLFAAYAQDAACQNTYENTVTQEVRDRVAKQSGTLTELSGERAKAFMARFTELSGTQAPPVDKIILVKPDDADDTSYNIGFFFNNCLVGFTRLPPTVAEGLLSPNVSPQGERVD
jgi:hypothetical protein